MVGESMTLDYITTLTSSGGSETLEFKATTGTLREVVLTVRDFLNRRTSEHMRTKAQ